MGLEFTPDPSTYYRKKTVREFIDDPIDCPSFCEMISLDDIVDWRDAIRLLNINTSAPIYQTDTVDRATGDRIITIRYTTGREGIYNVRKEIYLNYINNNTTDRFFIYSLLRLSKDLDAAFLNSLKPPLDRATGD